MRGRVACHLRVTGRARISGWRKVARRAGSLASKSIRTDSPASSGRSSWTPAVRGVASDGCCGPPWKDRHCERALGLSASTRTRKRKPSTAASGSPGWAACHPARSPGGQIRICGWTCPCDSRHRGARQHQLEERSKPPFAESCSNGRSRPFGERRSCMRSSIEIHVD